MSKLTISPKGAPDAVVEDDEGEDSKQVASDVVIEDDDGDEPKAKLPKRAILNEDGSVTLPLIERATLTIRKDGKDRQEAYSELIFHRLKGIDLRLVTQESTEMKRTIMALARSTRMSSGRMNALFDKLDQKDVEGATEIIAYFRG